VTKNACLFDVFDLNDAENGIEAFAYMPEWHLVFRSPSRRFWNNKSRVVS
jgi:hypothetical protein